MRSLQGKVFAVTGASRGIGAATARLLAMEGCRLALGGRDEAALEAVVRGCSEAGSDAIPIRCDVRSYEDCERLVAGAVERFGGLDGLDRRRPGDESGSLRPALVKTIFMQQIMP